MSAEVIARERRDRPDHLARVDIEPRRPLTEYERGYLDGLATYAWWKDGVQWVGTTGKTYRQAVRDFLNRVSA